MITLASEILHDLWCFVVYDVGVDEQSLWLFPLSNTLDTIRLKQGQKQHAYLAKKRTIMIAPKLIRN